MLVAVVITVGVLGEGFLLWFLVKIFRDNTVPSTGVLYQITPEKPEPAGGDVLVHRLRQRLRDWRMRSGYAARGRAELRRRGSALVLVVAFGGFVAHAQDVSPAKSDQQTPPDAPSATTWEYGGFIDVGYLHDFNYPDNHLFRGRGTTFHVNEWDVNNAMAYLRKRPTEQSRWGVELSAQAGKDTELFGYSATAPVLGGTDVAEALRHLGPTNVSYLAPIGKGLTIQGGIFSSFIGYDSLYAKDNFNYTRPWGADFTPYFMLGVNAQYTFNDKWSVAGFVVNGYWHLADANAVPSVGGQVAYKPEPAWTIRQTFLVGPHQADTSPEFTRFLTDTIVEWKTAPVTIAFDINASTERVATVGEPRAAWVAAQLPMRWQATQRWAFAVRPEVAWDSEGRWTLAQQTVKAFTGTIEYRYPIKKVNNILRLEYRVDDSRGPQGGFFSDGYAAPGVPHLKPTQHLLVFTSIWTLDGTFRRK